MKIITILLFFISSYSFSEDVITAFDASKKGIISCSFKGDSKGTHYTTPLSGIITNNKNKEIRIIIENGRTFIAEDSSYQNLIITEEKILVLHPNQKKTLIFHAMCIESSDRAPSESVLYTMGPIADDKLCKMTRFIGENKYFNSAGQNAVWAFSNNKPIEDIVGLDEENSFKIAKKAAELLGKPVPAKPSPDDYIHNLHSTNFKRTIEGFVEYEFSTTENVTIAMFDKNNMVVRELYHNSAENPGPHKQKFQFDGTVYTDKYYYIRLLIGGRIFYERKFELLPLHE